ncbi:MAG: TetR/AcrR family transcriptional regulator [Parvularculaceae bacterium]
MSEAALAQDEKTEAIVNAACETFLAKGFDGASMDQIALTAGVSKRTVYNRFRSKEELFSAAITLVCKNLLPVNVAEIETSSDPEEFLRMVGRQFLKGVLRPEALALRRIAAYEAGRGTPAIGRAYLDHGPVSMVHQCAPILKRLAARGVYRVDNPEDAIWQLGSLLSEPLYTQVILGDMPADLDAAIDHQVERGVKAFAKIYAPD